MADKTKKFEYTIDGVCYKQAPLVLGQAAQIAKELKGLEGKDVESLDGFINLLGDKLPILMAIVLTEKGTAMSEKDIIEQSIFMADNAGLEVVENVITDFFICNPITLLLERIEKATGIVGALMGQLMLKFYTQMSASSLQEGILQKVEKSSGATPQKK